MTKLRTTAIALVLAATTAAGVTGCSGSDKKAPTAKDAWNTAQDTLGTYKSLKMTAKGTDDGKPLEMSVEGTVDGKTQHITGKQGSGSFEMITVGGKTYMKANSAYYDQSSGTSSTDTDKAMGKAMADKWVEIPSSTTSELALTQSFIKDMRDDSDDDSKKLLSDKATVTDDSVDGKDAWKITSEDKKLSVWVSQDDKRDLLKASGMEGSKKDSMSEVTFGDANKSFDIKAPSGAKSITDLMGG